MKRFFSRNIDKKGRLIRGGWAFLLAFAAGFVFRSSKAAAVALALGSLFAFVEAIRGWCLLRACGIKTKY